MTRKTPPSYMDAYKEGFVAETAEFIHAYDTAHVVMLGEAGILPADTALALLDGLAEMERTGIGACRSASGGGNHAGERHLTATLGAGVGGAIGLARSSGDLSAISFRMYARDAALRLRQRVLVLRRGMLAFAAIHRDSVFAGNTHGQHAQPITFALWAMMYHDALARDGERLAAFGARANWCPAGAGIMAGTGFPINRKRVADLLGFDGVIPNTLDAALSHDLEIEYASVLNGLCYTLSRMAEDVFLWNTTEHSLVTLPDWFIGASSMMPQKRNPDGLQDLRNLSAQSQAALTMVMGTERGPTGFAIIERRNSDRALRTLTEGVMERLEVLPDLIAEMRIDTDRAEAYANANWASVTDIASAIVTLNGIEWRRAHHIVKGFVRDCIATGLAPAEVTADHFNAYASRCGEFSVLLNDAILTRALDARAFINQRETFGGPGPEAMDAAMGAATHRIAAEADNIDDLIARFAKAADALTAVVSSTIKARKFA